MQDELDTLATALIDALNEAYNAGTTLPAPDSLTGTTSVSTSDAFSATGTLRVALVDDEGGLVSYADFDLSTYSPVGDLVSAIDATAGLDASVTDGVLTIASTDGSGVALTDMDAEIGRRRLGFLCNVRTERPADRQRAADIRVSENVSANGFDTATLSTDATLETGATSFPIPTTWSRH